ncbi:MAG: LacI family DNA-binding transcriptional regulator [Chloroflexi bacterium]|nr:LacI family DNA-binding transcriptional regulator [Chloroflexota bacterium]
MAAVTIRDVAQKAGVGVGTVSRVLNDSVSVSQETRRKVLAAIAELDYSPNQAARRLSRGKTMVIGALVPYFTNPSVVRRLQGVVSVVTNSDYDLILFDVESVERRDVYLFNVPRRQMVDGLLIISLTPNDKDVARLQQSGLPTVLVDAHHPLLDRVIVNNVAGGYCATRHLLDLGHRRIAYISDFLDDPFNSPVRDRFAGYRQALAEAEVAFRPEYHVQGQHGRYEARDMTNSLLNLPEPPTAIFAYSDTQAIGVVECARERGFRIPQDLSVIGFDNIEAAEYLHITTIRQALFESGVSGCELLLEVMANPSPEPREIVLPIELVERSSTAPPPLQ